MKSKKLLSLLMAGTMVLSMAACGGEETSTTPDPTQAPAPTEAPAAEPTAEPAPAPVVEDASIDFEDGNMGFLQVYTVPANADDSVLEVVDYNGSKAVQVTCNGDVPYIGIDVQSLLGDNTEKLASMEVSVGVANPSGKFQAVSGEILAWSGEDLVESVDTWSVYLESANPKKAVATLKAGEEFVNGANNLFIIDMKVDNAKDAGLGNSTMYIDNIRFLDKDGNLLTADTTVAFAGPEAFSSSGLDMSNLAAVKGAVNFEGFACTGGAWAQNGFEMPQEVVDALVPGSVVEIAYTSETGNMWIVMPWATAGWMRVGDGGKSYTNNSKNICQITYEQIEALCGEDKSTWGAMMQCESDSNWEVFSVKVGQKAPVYAVGNAVEFPGFAVSGGAWAQNGLEMPQEIVDALVPGSVLEIDYTSETGNLWVVMPWATAGWMRVADGGNSVCYGGKCYVTYEQIEAMCGEDKSTWGAMLQCESDSNWEVFGLRVGTANEMKMVSGNVDFAGFACTGDAWAQNGFEMPQEIVDALVPGSVVTINYTSETGNMWIVMPWATAGWMRVGDGGKSACNNGICQVTYEQIEELCGTDKSTWGAMMQCESDSAWEVYSVSVGQSAQ